MHPRNPPWLREELILALALYMRAGRRVLHATDPEVKKLSDTLNRLPFHLDRPDALRFRNPNGVSMKLANFAAIDPESGTLGLSAAGRLDRDVWEDYAGDPARLYRTAEAIRLRHPGV